MADRHFMIKFEGMFNDEYLKRERIDRVLSKMGNCLDGLEVESYRTTSEFDFEHDYDQAYGIGWKWELADNGWADHVCPFCGFRENTDIHVHLDWKYCPNCGNFISSGAHRKRNDE